MLSSPACATKITSASRQAGDWICSMKILSPVWCYLMNTFGSWFPTMSRLGSSCSVAFITTRGRPW